MVLVALQLIGGVLVPVLHAETETWSAARSMESKHTKPCSVIHSEAHCATTLSRALTEHGGGPQFEPGIVLLTGTSDRFQPLFTLSSGNAHRVRAPPRNRLRQVGTSFLIPSPRKVMRFEPRNLGGSWTCSVHYHSPLQPFY